MTTYQCLCCLISPDCPGYQNILSSSYQPKNINVILPMSATDSYMGRLISYSNHINKSVTNITIKDIDDYSKLLNYFSTSTYISSRRFNKKMLSNIKSFLQYDLPMTWLLPMMEVYKLNLLRPAENSINLNDLMLLKILRGAFLLEYKASKEWFENNPKSICSASQYHKEE